MSFANNLRALRKQHHLSQEELADILQVSRQAVSKWELGNGYPEVETLLLLGKELDTSLDELMGNAPIAITTSDSKLNPSSILLISPYENVIVSGYKVISSKKMKGGKNSPHYALFTVSDHATFWGQPTTFLGWYAHKEDIESEISQIKQAMLRKEESYELQYSVKVKRHGMMMKIETNDETNH